MVFSTHQSNDWFPAGREMRPLDIMSAVPKCWSSIEKEYRVYLVSSPHPGNLLIARAKEGQRGEMTCPLEFSDLETAWAMALSLTAFCWWPDVYSTEWRWGLGLQLSCLWMASSARSTQPREISVPTARRWSLTKEEEGPGGPGLEEPLPWEGTSLDTSGQRGGHTAFWKGGGRAVRVYRHLETEWRTVLGTGWFGSGRKPDQRIAGKSAHSGPCILKS